MKINEKIKTLRKARKMSQEQLGKLLTPAISQQAVQQIESGATTPSYEVMENIAKAFGLVNNYFQECG